VVGNTKRGIGDFSEDTGLKGFGFYLGLRVWQGKLNSFSFFDRENEDFGLARFGSCVAL
jgi:hypothetical protein